MALTHDMNQHASAVSTPLIVLMPTAAHTGTAGAIENPKWSQPCTPETLILAADAMLHQPSAAQPCCWIMRDQPAAPVTATLLLSPADGS